MLREEGMDVSRAFSFVFTDPRWVVKLLIGGLMVLFSFLIVPALIGVGYAAQVIRDVMNEREQGLPEWSDLGRYLADGARLAVIYIAYVLPFMALFLLVAIGLAVGAATSRSGQLADAGIFAIIGTIYCLAPLYSLLLYFLAPAFIGHYLATNQLGAAFRFGELVTIVRRNLSDFLVVALLYLAVSMLASFGIVLCFVGVFFTSFYAYLVWAHLIGQAYRRAVGPAGTAPPSLPPAAPL
jgi:hypothetical protein